MYAIDFEYDGIKLSDFGFVICNFGSESSIDKVSAGANITFNKAMQHSGKRYSLAGTKYDECVSANFSICKNPEIYYNNQLISDHEIREIVRWLSRREFHKFKFIGLEDDYYYNASFTVSKVNENKETYGFELSMETDSPFAHGETITQTFTTNGEWGTFTIEDQSDVPGYLYPDVEIRLYNSGDLTIVNEDADCSMVIKNCNRGEVIKMHSNALRIESNLTAHSTLFNDFNYSFFRLSNTYANKENRVKVSLPCEIVITYAPLINISPD